MTMTAKRKRHSPEQIIRKLGEAEKMLAQGHDVPAVARELGVTEGTYYRLFGLQVGRCPSRPPPMSSILSR